MIWYLKVDKIGKFFARAAIGFFATAILTVAFVQRQGVLSSSNFGKLLFSELAVRSTVFTRKIAISLRYMSRGLLKQKKESLFLSFAGPIFQTDTNRKQS